MLVSPRSSRSLSVSRRAAFTLVEVLVVVAIVVILASVGTIATLTYLENAKIDAARTKAANLEQRYKEHMAKTLGASAENFQLGDLAQYFDDGERSLIDPWGQQYQFQVVQDAQTGRERMFFYTTAKMNGQQRMIGAPMDLEPQVNGG